jgi:NAD+ kinase
MVPKSALVMANRKKPIALRVKREVESFLRCSGISVSAPRPQLIITVGGDGTVLFSKKYYGIPFFSIGSKTSFICQATFANWKAKLRLALARMRTKPRALLESRLDGKRLPVALNEVGIRNPEPRVMSLHLSVGKRDFAFRADGILFSTATGSPAYCYSCGGKEMKAGSRDYQAVAISPFRRSFKPLLLPSAARCTLRLSGPERAQIFVDGQVVGHFSEKQSIRIFASRKKFLFLDA